MNVTCMIQGHKPAGSNSIYITNDSVKTMSECQRCGEKVEH